MRVIKCLGQCLSLGATLSVSSWQAQAGEQFRFACRVGVSNCVALHWPRHCEERSDEAWSGIPGRCEAANPESRDSGFASRPGMTTVATRRSTQRRQQTRHQAAALGETVDLDMFVER